MYKRYQYWTNSVLLKYKNSKIIIKVFKLVSFNFKYKYLRKIFKMHYAE